MAGESFFLLLLAFLPPRFRFENDQQWESIDDDDDDFPVNSVPIKVSALLAKSASDIQRQIDSIIRAALSFFLVVVWFLFFRLFFRGL